VLAIHFYKHQKITIMNGYDFIIVSKSRNDNFTVCKQNDVEKEIKRAAEYYSNQAETYRRYIVQYPDNAEYWRKQLTVTEETLSQGFEAVTFDEYIAREKRRYITGEVKEITEQEYWNALECLPPLDFTRIDDEFEYFFMSERYTLSFTDQYLHDYNSGKYYVKMVDLCDKSTWMGQ